YKVYLADFNITTEITPTSRAAMFRFTYGDKSESNLVIDAFDNGSQISVLPEKRMVIGYTTKNGGGVPDNFRNYFVIQFDRNFSCEGVVTDGYKDSLKTNSLIAEGNHAITVLSFGNSDIVNAKVASSFISTEQAIRNLESEIGQSSFDEIKNKGKDEWNKILGRINVDIDVENIDDVRTFYSCLYRSVLFPRSLYEIDASGNVVHYSPYNGKVLPGYMFTDTGFWDTFRSLFPLLNLMYPSINEKMQQGLANAYRESGYLPEWASPGHRRCMIGNNSASVVADAVVSGVNKNDLETLWQAVVHGAHSNHPDISSVGRLGYDQYNELGYVPCDVGIRESAARTLEYAYDDWCIFQMGKFLNKPQNELREFEKRALNYRNLFDKSTSLMRGRMADGKFAPDFNPVKWGGDFTEGNSLHYTWSVFHNPADLIKLMGGYDKFSAMLDTIMVMPPTFDDSYYGGVIHEIREMQVMNMGQYAHGNQPAQHMLYLYNYCGQPWKSQYWIREAMNRLYSATPDGYCGDEDNGQTSAWYVFSALGFYPVCPASGQYVLGAPHFKHVTLNLENGNKVEINADKVSDECRYVNNMWLNNNRYDKNYIEIPVLKSGAELKYDMSSEPNKNRGTKKESYPYSFSD
ncbi:MAG: GH92 family glycosyl hydrolase, partial [Bacteroidales bacterium]|nr:GH92 family glycosyl hydrolase [Candidatus Sodaliphilus aphodohippi]